MVEEGAEVDDEFWGEVVHFLRMSDTARRWDTYSSMLSLGEMHCGESLHSLSSLQMAYCGGRCLGAASVRALKIFCRLKNASHLRLS